MLFTHLLTRLYVSAGKISAKIIEMMGHEKSVKDINYVLHNEIDGQSQNKTASDKLVNLIKLAGNEDAYQNYLKVREWVLVCIEDKKSDKDISLYWNEEISGFDYMFDASPLIIKKLREHCYHITGLKPYEYRSHHIHEKKAFENKLKELQKIDGGTYFVSENRALGGFGHDIDGSLINIDTLKYYECLLALNKSINLSSFYHAGKAKKTVLEIGAGWGGFAYQCKILFSNTCYIIIDIPETILFSGTYLKTLFKNCRFLFYGEAGFSNKIKNYHDYDFIFFPHYALNNIPNIALDLCVNIASFQEMTTRQVSDYLEKVYELGCPYLYSLNRDRSKHNTELTAVSEIINKRYEISEIEIMDIAYYTLKVSKESSKHTTKSIHEYKHLFGKRTAN
jgi:putative sugar O-methyltransferase